jgi:hypothetical protein
MALCAMNETMRLGGVWVKRKYGALLGRYEIRDTMQARIEKADLT